MINLSTKVSGEPGPADSTSFDGASDDDITVYEQVFGLPNNLKYELRTRA